MSGEESPGNNKIWIENQTESTVAQNNVKDRAAVDVRNGLSAK